MRDMFLKYKKVELIEKLRPFVDADPNFVLTDAQGKKRRGSLIKADKYSLANTLAEKYATGAASIPGGDPFNPTGAMPGAPSTSQTTPQSSPQPAPQPSSQSTQPAAQPATPTLTADFEANVDRQQTGETDAEHIARALNHVD